MVLLALAGVLAFCALAVALARAGQRDRPRRLGAPREGAGPVSVIVPARDEAHNLDRLLGSLTALGGVEVEIIVVDGDSSDGSAALVSAWAARDGRVRLVREPQLPRGWVGKPWACHIGRQHATHPWLLFTDADTMHAPTSLARAVATAKASGAQVLTGVTRQELGSWWERVAMPPVFTLIQAAVGGEGASSIRDPAHAVANGQYMLFRAEAYDALGGHASVGGSVVEDLAFARHAAAQQVPAHFADLTDEVRVRMYRGVRAMFAGWRKNVATGASRTPPRAFAMTVATFSAGTWAAPLAIAALGVGAWPAAAVAGATYGVMAWRIHAAQRDADGANWTHALLHPVGYAFFAVVLMASAWDLITGRGPTWKGRRYPSAR